MDKVFKTQATVTQTGTGADETMFGHQSGFTCLDPGLPGYGYTMPQFGPSDIFIAAADSPSGKIHTGQKPTAPFPLSDFAHPLMAYTGLTMARNRNARALELARSAAEAQGLARTELTDLLAQIEFDLLAALAATPSPEQAQAQAELLTAISEHHLDTVSLAAQTPRAATSEASSERNEAMRKPAAQARRKTVLDFLDAHGEGDPLPAFDFADSASFARNSAPLFTS